MTGDVRLAPLTEEHAGELFTVQRAAFVGEAQRYTSAHIPPLVETLAQLRADLASPAVPAVGAWLGPRLVGSVRGRPNGVRMEVARLAVAPDLQGAGIGGLLLTAIEAAAPDGVRTIWLTTPTLSAENLRFYQRAGYQPRGTRTDAAGVVLTVLEKSVVSDR